MRYRITDAGMTSVTGSADVTTATVWLTLFIGVLFLVLGVRGRQGWLKFWGGLTVICCAAYFMRSWLHLPALS